MKIKSDLNFDERSAYLKSYDPPFLSISQPFVDMNIVKFNELKEKDRHPTENFFNAYLGSKKHFIENTNFPVKISADVKLKFSDVMKKKQFSSKFFGKNNRSSKDFMKLRKVDKIRIKSIDKNSRSKSRKKNFGFDNERYSSISPNLTTSHKDNSKNQKEIENNNKLFKEKEKKNKTTPEKKTPSQTNSLKNTPNKSNQSNNKSTPIKGNVNQAQSSNNKAITNNNIQKKK